MEDLREALGAGPPAGVDQIVLFVPSVDRDERPIDQSYWADQSLRTFGTLFRGGTALAPGRGVWRDDDRGGQLVFDETQVIFSYIEEGGLTQRQTVSALRSHLHRLGRDGGQGEVGIIVDGTYLGITEFDQEAT